MAKKTFRVDIPKRADDVSLAPSKPLLNVAESWTPQGADYERPMATVSRVAGSLIDSEGRPITAAGLAQKIKELIPTDEFLRRDGQQSLTLSNINALRQLLFGDPNNGDFGLLTAGPQDLSDPESVLPLQQLDERFQRRGVFRNHRTPEKAQAVQTGGSNGSITTFDQGVTYALRAGNTGGETLFKLGPLYSVGYRSSLKPLSRTWPFDLTLGIASFPSGVANNRFRIYLNAPSSGNAPLPEDGSQSGVIAEIQWISGSTYRLRLGVAARGVMTWVESGDINRFSGDIFGTLKLSVRDGNACWAYYPSGLNQQADRKELTLSGVSSNFEGDSFLRNGGFVSLSAKSENPPAYNSSICGTFMYIENS